MAASNQIPVLIVGAGPTGLAAALFLVRRGVSVRIIDAATRPGSTSRALLVNPRSLSILDECGVAARIVAEGYAVTGGTIHRGSKAVGSIDLLGSPSSQPPICLAQARTEALLCGALHAQGIQVERGTRAQTLQQDARQVTLTLQQADGGMQNLQAALVFGADGARSAMRHALGVGFSGSTLPEPWLLWDLRLDTSLDPRRAHIVLVPDGFLFMLRLHTDIWRVIGNGSDPLSQLPAGSVPGDVLWQSHFHISHRVAGRACVGRVALGGDAAHIHSPLGARGMNLGIEDAWVFADCAADALAGRPERMREYNALRHPVHLQVVHRIAAMTRMMRGRPAALRWLRDHLMSEALKLPPLRRAMRRTITGIDHPLHTRR